MKPIAQTFSQANVMARAMVNGSHWSLVMKKVMLSDLDESSSEIPFQLFDKVIEHYENNVIQ